MHFSWDFDNFFADLLILFCLIYKEEVHLTPSLYKFLLIISAGSGKAFSSACKRVGRTVISAFIFRFSPSGHSSAYIHVSHLTELCFLCLCIQICICLDHICLHPILLIPGCCKSRHCACSYGNQKPLQKRKGQRRIRDIHGADLFALTDTGKSLLQILYNTLIRAQSIVLFQLLCAVIQHPVLDFFCKLILGPFPGIQW